MENNNTERDTRHKAIHDFLHRNDIDHECMSGEDDAFILSSEDLGRMIGDLVTSRTLLQQLQHAVAATPMMQAFMQAQEFLNRMQQGDVSPPEEEEHEHEDDEPDPVPIFFLNKLSRDN